MIKLVGVKKTLGGQPVLQGVDLSIPVGKLTTIVGRSGEGKSVLLKHMIGLMQPDRGEVWVGDVEISRLSGTPLNDVRKQFAMLFQGAALFDSLSVFENVAFALEVIGRPNHVISAQVPQILDLVGLTKKSDNFPTELSGGEQQRVSIARAFVNRPLILLADEPTGNLDPATSVGIMRLLDRINRTGTTVVMATHDQGIVDSMRRRVIELDRGVVVRDQARGVYGAGTS